MGKSRLLSPVQSSYPQAGRVVHSNTHSIGLYQSTGVEAENHNVPRFPTMTASGPSRPELVFGLIGPVGCGLDGVIKDLDAQLGRYGYRSVEVKVSSSFRDLKYDPWRSLPTDQPADDRYEAYMDAGDHLRTTARRKDEAMLPALLDLRRKRSSRGSTSAVAEATAFIVDSLKTPEEVALLRRIYGDRFLAVACHSPRDDRKRRVERSIADSRHAHRTKSFSPSAERLLNRDERGTEDTPYGQNVSNAFPLADLFIHSAAHKTQREEIARFVDLVFGDVFITPTRDEMGMAHASFAALQSAALGRQVGAAVTLPSGQLLAAGCNEVPKAGGGPYWAGDDPDVRGFRQGCDISEDMRRNLLGNTIEALLDSQWVPPGVSPEQLAPVEGDDERAHRARREMIRKLAAVEVKRLDSDDVQGGAFRLRRNLLIRDTIEFYREVHAEMAALLDAARRGAPVQDATLYTTAFPCHECARHIVDAGIRRVVFLKPYPKSLVAELHADSIVLDPPHEDAGGRVRFETYVGVAPDRMAHLFRVAHRKDSNGRMVEFHEKQANLRPEYFGLRYGANPLGETAWVLEARTSLALEQVAVEELDAALETGVGPQPSASPGPSRPPRRTTRTRNAPTKKGART